MHLKTVFAIDGLQKGGAQRVFVTLMDYMIDKNIEVNLILLNNSSFEYKINPKISIYYVDSTKKTKKNFLLKIIIFAKYKFRMRKLLRKIKPDIILSFLPIMNLITLSANNRKYPIIISSRNDPKIEFPNFIYKFLMKKIYPKTDGIIFQTNDQKIYFDNLKIRKKFKIIPNPINDKFMIKKYNGKKDKTIVSVGRLIKQKNQKIIIDAFNEIKNQIPDYKLIIYGEGNLREQLENQINNLNLNDKVFLPGNINNVENEIYKSSLFILSSNYEGMPNALMEAMALGLPVVSTNCPCGGPKSLIKNNENGILIPVNDVKQLSNAILKIINDKEFSKKLEKNASKIQNQLNSKTISEKYYKFFNEIIDERNKK